MSIVAVYSKWFLAISLADGDGEVGMEKCHLPAPWLFHPALAEATGGVGGQHPMVCTSVTKVHISPVYLPQNRYNDIPLTGTLSFINFPL
jgi:hypothetical protein